MQGIEVPRCQRHRLEVRLGRDGGGPRTAVDQRDLAEIRARFRAWREPRRPTETVAWPSTIMWNPTPDSPCFAMSFPAGKETSFTIAATRCSSLSPNPLNNGTDLIRSIAPARPSRPSSCSRGATGPRRPSIGRALGQSAMPPAVRRALRTVMREEDQVAQRRRVREHHEQPVDADPIPPVGGMPCSSAVMKSSSSGCASSSPAARCATCSSNFARCSIGSVSSENAVPSSTPPTMTSKCSVSAGSLRCGPREWRDLPREVAHERGLEDRVLHELLEELQRDLARRPTPGRARRGALRRGA